MKLSFICTTAMVLFLFVTLSCVTVAPRNDQELVQFITDTNYAIGKTKNGTTYYLRDNPSSEKKITVALIVKAGSILEEDNQLGLAHFVEHMGFNGSVKFPHNEVIKTLERHGVRFGKDLNARTSFDETVFHITIPSEKKALLPLLLDVAEEWAHNLSYDPEEIEKEKGVVQEEIRRDLQPFRYAWMKAQKFLLEGSHYAQRMPAGTLEIIGSASRNVIKSFYDTWYKPNLMALAVIGDIDIPQVQKEVLQRFQYEDTTIERPEYPLPLVKSDDIEVAFFPIDEETELPLGYIAQFRPAHKSHREALLDQIMSFMINYRFFIVSEKSTKLKQAYVDNIPLGTRGEHLSLLIFIPYKNRSHTAFETVVTEMERLRRFGITENEYKTVINYVIKNLENDKKTNRSFLDDIVGNFVRDDVLVDNKKIIPILKSMLHNTFISREEINARLANFDKQFKTRIALIYPIGETIPKAEEFTTFYKNASTLALTQKKATEKITALLSEEDKKQLKHGSVVEHDHDKKSGIHTLVLKNGVTAYFKRLKTAEKRITILGSAENARRMKHSKTKRDVFTAKFGYNKALDYAKIGGYDKEKRQQYLRDALIGMSSFYEDKRGISVSAPPKTLEVAFEFLHVLFSDIRYDPTKDEIITHDIKSAINVEFTDDRFHLLIRYKNAMFPKDPFRLNMDDYKITNFDGKKAFSLVEESFDSIGDYTFYIVGNVSIQSIKKMLSTYFSTLPTRATKQDARIHYDSGLTKKEKTHIEYTRGKEQTRVIYGWAKKFSDGNFTIRDRVMQTFISNIVSTEMMEKIREKESAVYHISSFFNSSIVPEHIGQFGVMFSSIHDRAPEIIKKSQALIHKLAHGEIEQDIVKRARLKLLTSYREIADKPATYARTMRIIKENFDADITQTGTLQENILTSITYEDVSKYLKNFLQGAKYVEVVQNPKE